MYVSRYIWSNFVQATRSQSDLTWHLQKKQLIFDPVEHVRNIFSPFMPNFTTSESQGATTSVCFSFLWLEGWSTGIQPSTIEFQLIDISELAMPCFSNFGTTSSPMFKIIKATYVKDIFIHPASLLSKRQELMRRKTCIFQIFIHLDAHWQRGATMPLPTPQGRRP